jgi:hypothetical protein
MRAVNVKIERILSLHKTLLHIRPWSLSLVKPV